MRTPLSTAKGVERTVWLVNAALVVGLVLLFAVGIGFLSVYGDPGEGPERSEALLSARVHTSGRVTFGLELSRERTDARRVAVHVHRALEQSGLPTVMSQSTDRKSRAVTDQFRTRSAPLAHGRTWRLNLTPVGRELAASGVRNVHLDLSWPQVRGPLHSDPQPDDVFRSRASWFSWDPTQPLTLSLALRPEPTGFIRYVWLSVAAGVLSIGSLVFIFFVRRRAGRTASRRVLFGYLITGGVTGVVLLEAATAAYRTADGYFTAHPTTAYTKTMLEWGPIALLLAAGVWALLGCTADLTRRMARGRERAARSAPPAWYPDPSQPTAWRFWDGQRWH